MKTKNEIGVLYTSIETAKRVLNEEEERICERIHELIGDDKIVKLPHPIESVPTIDGNITIVGVEWVHKYHLRLHFITPRGEDMMYKWWFDRLQDNHNVYYLAEILEQIETNK